MIGTASYQTSTVFPDGEHTQQCLDGLAYQQPPQVSVNSKKGNAKENKTEAYQKAKHAVEKGKSCFPKPVQNTAQCTGDVHKRA